MLQGMCTKSSSCYLKPNVLFLQCGDEGHMSRECPTAGGGGGGGKGCFKVTIFIIESNIDINCILERYYYCSVERKATCPVIAQLVEEVEVAKDVSRYTKFFN